MQQPPAINPSGNEDQVMCLLAPAPQARSSGQWSKLSALCIGITFVIIAILAVACNIGWFFAPPSLGWTGIGFWAGGLVFATGVMTIISGIRPSNCLIISLLVMSILTAVAATAFIFVGGFQLGMYGSDSGGYGIGVLFIDMGLICFGLLLLMYRMSSNSRHSRNSILLTTAYNPQSEWA